MIVDAGTGVIISHEEKQAEFYAREMLTNVANGIPLSIWYDWRDDGADPRDPEHHFGLVEHDTLQPKPAYLAATTLNSFLKSYEFERRLTVGSSDDYVLSFTNGSDVRYCLWTTLAATHFVTLSIPAGEWIVTSTKGDSQRISVGREGLKIQISDAPRYLRRK